jgi:hypothetical protein
MLLKILLLIALILLIPPIAHAQMDSNDITPTPNTCSIHSDCDTFSNINNTTPLTLDSNSTDYEHGHILGLLLAKNCHSHAVIKGSHLFVNGFLDGYATMNVTKCQDLGFV